MDKNKANVPKIRFPGFTDPWERRKAGDIFFTVADKNHPELPVLSASQELGMIKRDDSGINISHNKENEVGYKRVMPGQFVIHLRSFQGGFAHSNIEGITSPAYTVIDFVDKSNHYDNFWKYIFSSESFIKRLELITYGIRDGRSISYSDFATLPFKFPKYEEQKKIGDYFIKFGNLITLHQRKLNHLQDKKKGLLQKMFPKNGEDFPELRFPGFTDPWEQRKLRELSSLITKGTTPLDKSGNGNINFIKIENVDPSSGEIISTAKITKEEHEGYLKRSQLQENDILFSIAGTLGRVAIVNKDVLPANTNQALAIIRLKNGCLNYITTYLKGKAVSVYIKKNPTIGAQPNLSLEQIGNLEISLPKEEEQIQIGEFFQQLDNLIILNQRKLNHLKEQKKSLLQQMFV